MSATYSQMTKKLYILYIWITHTNTHKTHPYMEREKETEDKMTDQMWKLGNLGKEDSGVISTVVSFLL